MARRRPPQQIPVAPMIQALTVLFLCQLVGEIAVRLMGIAFPGPVLGMALLVAILAVRPQAQPAIEGAADGILRNLSLLFVPAAVGVVQQLDLIMGNWLAILVAVAVSMLLTLIVTVYTFRAVSRIQARRGR